jgi:hypothetical protein
VQCGKDGAGVLLTTCWAKGKLRKVNVFGVSTSIKGIGEHLYVQLNVSMKGVGDRFLIRIGAIVS